MLAVSAILVCTLIGTVLARQPDIDINRIRLVPENSPLRASDTVQSRRSIATHRFSRNNDNDNYSSRFRELRTPVQFVHKTTPSDKKTIKVHRPREDPRLFYQSDTYLQKTNRENINREVSSIYPGIEIVRAAENYRRPPRLSNKESNSVTDDLMPCVKCPHDRTLIAKVGADRVFLQHPRLLTCSGWKAPRKAHFVHMYGPRFGSLLQHGSHMIIGRVTYAGQTLQTCKLQVHVVMQSCPTPKYLLVDCQGDQNKTCSFSCRDGKLELQGNSTLKCGNDFKWNGDLPVCRVQTWCEPPAPPEHGRVSCKGETEGDGPGLVEGSTCRVRCKRGWRWSSRAAAVCRRGSWTQHLSCQPKRNK